MAELTAASWTVTITHRRRGNRTKVVEGTMALPAADTYPDAGIPLPVIGKFGFIRDLRNLVLWGDNVENTQYLVSVDKANHRLKLYVSHDTAGATALPMDEEGADAPGARTWNFRAEGW